MATDNVTQGITTGQPHLSKQDLSQLVGARRKEKNLHLHLDVDSVKTGD